MRSEEHEKPPALNARWQLGYTLLLYCMLLKSVTIGYCYKPGLAACHQPAAFADRLFHFCDIHTMSTLDYHFAQLLFCRIIAALVMFRSPIYHGDL